MKAGRGIDHLVLAVRDLDAAAACYERWGFSLTPRGLHPWGTANRLVQFDDCFLELLEIDRPALIAPAPRGGFSFGARVRDYLDRREGMAMLVFASHDAGADHVEFTAAGLAVPPRFDFARKARLPDGGEVTVGFSLVFVTTPRAPDATIFTCQQHAPQHFWKPDYQRHANGVGGIAEVVMVADRPDEWRGHFAAIQGGDAVRAVGGGLEVLTARGRVVVSRPDEASARFGGSVAAGPDGTPCFAGMRLRAARCDVVEAALAASGTAFRRIGDRVVVPPDQAFGCGIEFATA